MWGIFPGAAPRRMPRHPDRFGSVEEPHAWTEPEPITEAICILGYD